MSNAAPPREPTVRELAGRLGEQLSQLVRDELELAKAELRADARRATPGSALLAAAAATAAAGGLCLVSAVVLAVALALPAWAAALICGAGFLLIAGACASLGMRSLAREGPPLRETTASIRDQLHEIAARRSS